MSAFILGNPHISAMIRLAQHYGRDTSWRLVVGEEMDPLRHPNALGRELLKENVASVSYRYEGRVSADDLPGTYRFDPSTGQLPTPIEGLKVLACYEYQTCEHPQWEESKAKKFCETLRESLITNLPGYNKAPWEWR